MTSGPIDRTWPAHDRVRYVRTGLVGGNEGRWANDVAYHAAIAGLVGLSMRIADIAAKDPAAADRILQSVRLVDEGESPSPRIQQAAIDLGSTRSAPPAPRAVSDTEPNIGTAGF